jgi:hypothetical protein
MKAGEAFPEAISELSPWLSKAASGGDVTLHQFQATGLARRFPESSLVFLDAVLTAAFIALPDPLKSCLEQTEPKLRGDPRFERLTRRARELGG